MPVTPFKKSVIVIVGPTAVGKTAIAIEIAKHFHTEIISADSRQCYEELNIGVARPSEEELKEVKHHFIADHSIQEEISAAGFERYALRKVNELFQQHDVAVMVGGTGLYIKAFCEGLDEIPAVPEAVRQNIIQQYEEKGITWLQENIKEKDPEFYKRGEMKNPQRIMRALEIVESTGRSIFDFHRKEKIKRDFNIIKAGLELPRKELQERINRRVDKMMESGLLAEVKDLLLYKNLNALQTVGYNELFSYFEGKTHLEDAIGLIKKNTRQYAKRQMTWFRKDKEVKWFSPEEVKEMIVFAEMKQVA